MAKRKKHIIESRMYNSGAAVNNEYKDNMQNANRMHQMKKKNFYHFQGKGMNINETGLKQYRPTSSQYSYPK